MIVDAHMHVGVWDHPDFLGRSATLDDALAALDDAGIDGAVLMPTDRCDNAGLLHAARERLAAGHRGPLWLMPWVRPLGGPAGDLPGSGRGADAGSTGGADAGSRDLAWVREHRASLAGLKIHPSLSRVRVTDPGFAPFLDLAAELDLVVLVHCGRWQEMASYRFAIEAAQTRPAVRFLLAHAGGDTPPLATAAAERVAATGVDNVWFDIAGLREYWVVERNIARIGADRYLLGSDYCLAHPRMYLGAIAGMKLGDRDRERVLGGNARELLGPPLAP